MTYATGTPHDFTLPDRRRLARRLSALCIAGAAALAVSALANVWRSEDHPAVRRAEAPPPAAPVPMPAAPAPILVPKAYGVLLDPALTLGVAPASLGRTALLGPRFEAPAPAEPASAPVVETEAVVPAPVPAIPQLVESAPLPMPRPPELAGPAGAAASAGQAGRAPFRTAGRAIAPQMRPSLAAPPAADTRTFFEKLFGLQRPSGPVLAYAAPEESAVIGRGQGFLSGAAAPYGRWTAVYDIAAHTVYMPDGTKLEAHSGLGDRLDDPNHVADRDRGPTPPHVYDLEPRAQLFHGVQALRLNPVGSGGIFGRTGLLAHTYMLGPNGDSNGCVSFRNYNAFLQAYLNGAVRRLVVVPRLI